MVAFARLAQRGRTEYVDDAKAPIVIGTLMAATRIIAIGVNIGVEIRDCESCTDWESFDLQHERGTGDLYLRLVIYTMIWELSE